MEDEAKFPFDVKGFQKAVDQMSNSISSMETKLNKFGSTMQKSVSKGIMFATAKIGLLIKGFKSMMKNMPEIGQAFKIAGDIVNKEFFFPIRQQIMPYLQKMLDWTRDHRALFAKWGQAVADVLKTVIDVGKTLWNTLKDVTEILTNSLQRGLGTSFKSLDEFVSVLQVKIAFITLLIGDVIKKMVEKISPTFEYIVEKGSEILRFFASLASSWLTLNGNGDSLITVLDKVYQVFDKIIHVIGDSLVGFFEGLMPPLKNLMTPIDNIADSFLRLLNIFGEDDNSGLRAVFKWLGNFTGNALVIAFEELAWAIDTVVVGIQTLAQSGKLLTDFFSGNWSKIGEDWKATKDIFKGYGERTSATGQRQVDAFKDMFSIDDGIITKKGQIIKLNPDDNIYAFKNANNIKQILSAPKNNFGSHGVERIFNDTKNFNTSNFYNNEVNNNETNNEQIFNNTTNETPKLEIPALRQSLSAPMDMIFNVTVTEGNAQAVGQQLGYSIHKSFVDRLKEQQMVRGW